MEITAKLGELEEHFPLGGFENAVQIENTAAGHFLLEKREHADSDSVIAAACDAALIGSSPELASVMVLGCAIEEFIRRYRLLSEVDDESLADIDTMTLDNLDYVVL